LKLQDWGNLTEGHLNGTVQAVVQFPKMFAEVVSHTANLTLNAEQLITAGWSVSAFLSDH
jgi:hypothetical protein